MPSAMAGEDAHGRTPAVPGLTVLVVDDEAPALSEMKYLLEQDERVGRILTASSGTGALGVLERERVDLVLSDISMPGLDGMALARVVSRFAERPRIVFVTAHEEHAVDAFALDADDYVVKPVRAARLREAVRRVVQAQPREAAPADQEPPEETVPVELAGVTRLVKRSDIRWVEAHGDYVRLHTATGGHLVRIPMATLEERWASVGFVRIHRSTLVSARHIQEVRTDHGRCTVVVEGIPLQVSRRHTRDLRELLARGDAGVSL